MKKGVIVILILSILLIVPLVQAQTYSGFNRFTDNVKLFFSFGDNKVKVALDIKEKEVDSALENAQTLNNEGADKNLERAWKKLQMIQEKVSTDTAGEVNQSSYEIRKNITEIGNLTDNFEVYILEEEKTGLTAEWVIEVNGKEGQNQTNEVVGEVNENQTRVVEIEKRVDEIDDKISNWVVEHTYAEGTTAGGEGGVVVVGGLAKVVTDEITKGDNGLKPEVKTSVAGNSDNKIETSSGGSSDETHDDNSAAEGNEGATDNIEEGDGGEGDYAEGTTVGGADLGDTGVDEGTEGTNDVAPATDSNEGD